MPDDQTSLSLYDEDAVLWSERQAGLLRRLAAGERVNAQIDWANVIEEIESVGRSERHAVESLLVNAIEHLLKIHGWPGLSVGHRRREAGLFLLEASRLWTPAMAQRIEMDGLYASAVRRTELTAEQQPPVRPIPRTSPYALADLIATRDARPDIDGLLARLSA